MPTAILIALALALICVAVRLAVALGLAHRRIDDANYRLMKADYVLALYRFREADDRASAMNDRARAFRPDDTTEAARWTQCGP